MKKLHLSLKKRTIHLVFAVAKEDGKDYYGFDAHTFLKGTIRTVLWFTHCPYPQQEKDIA